MTKRKLLPLAAPEERDHLDGCSGLSLVYFVVTFGRSGLMARFDDDWRFEEWTPYVKRATVFESEEEGRAAIGRLAFTDHRAARAAIREERRSIKQFVRDEFRAARNPTRQTGALLGPRDRADEYTLPVSARSRLAASYAHA